MSTHFDERYLTWLYQQVGNPEVRVKSRSHWQLLGQLYQKEFLYFVPNDKNRAANGCELRAEFVEVCGVPFLELGWMERPCSVLEVLVDLSRDLSFQTGGEVSAWFWELLDNIGLKGYSDRYYNRSSFNQIDQVINRVLYRQYAQSGVGGLFPLKWPADDQREVELWYQLSAYILERS